MSRIGPLLQALAALLFLASSMAFALSTGTSGGAGSGNPSIPFPGQGFPRDGIQDGATAWMWQQQTAGEPVAPRPPELARPPGAGLRLLLGAVWVAVLMLAASALRTVARPDTTAGPPGPERLALAAALVCGAAWPWTAQITTLGGFFAAAGMAGFAVLAALGIAAGPGAARPGQPRWSLGFFAGWAVIALYSSLAAILVQDLGLSVALATLVGAALLLGTAVEIQLRLGSVVAFSLAIMWAMIAFAAQSIGSDITVTLTAIAAVAGLAAVMVQVLS